MFNLFRYLEKERLIHSIKTVIAALIGFVLVRSLGGNDNRWIIISIGVVMCSQLYVGSVLQKSYLRFVGTAAGCLFASFVLMTMGYDNKVIAITLALAYFIFSYIATSQENLSYAGTLGAVTTSIVLLDNHPTVLIAFQRFFDISLGILTASLVSQFILPIHARAHLKRAQANTLKGLTEYYSNIMQPINSLLTENNQELEEVIVKSLLKQRQLAKESKNEPLAIKFNIDKFKQSLFYEREMLRAIIFMYYAKKSLIDIRSSFLNLPQLLTFHEKNKRSLLTLVKALEIKKIKEISNIKIYYASLSDIKTLLNQPHPFSRTELADIDVFLFAADIFSTNLVNLAKSHGLQVVMENV